MFVHVAPVTSSTIVVAVGVGKTSAMFSVTDAARHRLVVWWMHVTGADSAELVAAARLSPTNPVVHLADPAPATSLISQVIDMLADASTPPPVSSGRRRRLARPDGHRRHRPPTLNR